MVTWGLLLVLAVIGLLGLRNLYRHNREYRKYLMQLRLRLLLLDIIQEGQVVLGSVRRQDFAHKSRLVAICERLSNLIERLNKLEALHEKVCAEYRMPPDEAVESHLLFARTTLLGCLSFLKNAIVDLEVREPS
jgi:hypothetical protein